MKNVSIFAFADEASGMIDGQIAALKRNELNGLEIRGVDGQNIAAISLEKAREVHQKLADAGLSVWSMGSPIGKIDIVNGDFAAHLEALRHVLDLAHVLESSNLRMFSFYVPQDQISVYRQKVIDQLGEMLRVAEGSGVAMCHENEKGIYGDNAERCNELLTIYPSMDCVFDPANFVQCGQDTLEAWKLLSSRVKYLHIKDALADGRVVPAGCGIGNVKQIVADYTARGGFAMTIEPHLAVFDGFAALEQNGAKTQMDSFCYKSSDEAFDAACSALKGCL